MKFKTQKRLAAEMLGIGVRKVWLDPLMLEEIKQAITKADIKDLIKDKAIRVKQSRKKKIKNERRKRRGRGSVKKSIAKRKATYVKKIRKLRKYLKEEKEKKTISKEDFKELRKMARAGYFKNLRQLKEHVKEAKK